MSVQQYDLWIDGSWVQTQKYEELVAPYSQEVIAHIAQASPTDAKHAIEAAHQAFASYGKLPAHRRSAILYAAVAEMEERREELAQVLVQEAAKPILAARGEMDRTIETYRFAAEEAKRISGEQLPMDAATGGEGRLAFALRVPLGVVTAITPFNFPFNLVAHKLGPALAAGNTIVLKPAEQTPLSSLLLADIFTRAGLPAGVLNIVTGHGAELSEVLTSHPLVQKISFTGSPAVGKIIQSQAELRRTTLELGSNSAVIIDKGTDIESVVERCVTGAFTYSGQVCISLQRILVHDSLYERFCDLLVEVTGKLIIGSPDDDKTNVSSLISEKAADRVQTWIEEAVAAGARIICGGMRGEPHIITPAVLTDVPLDAKVWTEEVFGPVAVVRPFAMLDEAIDEVNQSRYGLHAGIYTSDIGRAFTAAQRIEAGGIIINDIPTFRVDHMPYSGVKQSGKGTEGVSYAVQEMTRLKLISIHLG